MRTFSIVVPACRAFFGTLLLPMVCVLSVGTGWASEDFDAMLPVIRARDAQLDNAVLRYTTRGIVRPEGDWKTGAPASDPIPVAFHERMIVRGDDTTFIRELEPSLFPDPEKMAETPLYVLPYQKWSNTEGKMREIINPFPLASGKTDQMLLRIDPRRPQNAPDVQRWETELALGIGFAKRITAIDSITSSGDGWIVKGVCELWKGIETAFRAELDEDFLVRDALLTTRAEPLVTFIEVSTAGTVTKGQMVFAESGTFVHETVTLNEEGEEIGDRKALTQLRQQSPFSEVWTGRFGLILPVCRVFQFQNPL
ncbi:MAG: hypothetical protein RLY93_13735 [Sumerlaeia bacterium]